MRTLLAVALAAVALTTPLVAQSNLSVVRVAPEGEITDISQGREIRVTFSEPMVAAGAAENAARPAWFSIAPAAAGTFRWLGTTTLVFRPEPVLPLATRYGVTIGAEARALSGRTLGTPYRFEFSTPTLRLVDVRWQRPAGSTGPLVLALRFNQPVDPAGVLPHLRVRTIPHEPTVPSALERRRLAAVAPAAARELGAKLDRLSASGSARPVLVFLAEEWDTESLGSGDRIVALQTGPGVQPGSRVQVTVAPEVPSATGNATPGFEQVWSTEIEPLFFVSGIDCVARCNPERRNAINFSVPVEVDEFARALRVTDVTNPSSPVSVRATAEIRDTDEWYDPSSLTLEDAGYVVVPGRTLKIELDPALRSAGGQELGYRWTARIDNWHLPAYASFGEGHGVWETGGGSVIPFWARNLTSVRQWLQPLNRETLVPKIVESQLNGFRRAPATAPTMRPLTPAPDRVESFGFDVAGVAGEVPRGLLVAALEPGQTLSRAELTGPRVPVASIIQATDLGLTVKDGVSGSLVFVTALSTGEPVPGAAVEIRNMDNVVLWRGTTAEDGVALVPPMTLRRNPWDVEFVVIASKGDDIAYLASDWNEGLQPWSFGMQYDVESVAETRRGVVFTDRGIYRPGEVVNVKAIVRSDRPDGMHMLPRGTQVSVEVRDARSRVIDTRTVSLGDWSSADWQLTVPESAALGDASITLRFPDRSEEIWSSFMIGAYRRPEFRVDVTANAAENVAGATIEGVVAARYLSGEPMPGREVRWSWTARPVMSVPEAIVDRWGPRGLRWLGSCGDDEVVEQREVERRTARLDTSGRTDPSISSDAGAGVPMIYTLEGEVVDRTRQRIAGRSSFLVHPADFYVGVGAPSSFLRQGAALQSEVIAVRPDATTVAGVDVELTFLHVQWHSSRRAEGNGFYTWDSERRETVMGSRTIRTADGPVPFALPLDRAGQWIIRARATDASGRTTTTCVPLWVYGGSYASWQRFDHNRIDLLPERATWSPGETARLMLRSPWEEATALVTTEREGVRSHHVMVVDSTQPQIMIPITEDDVPNVYVSVVLVKGRTSDALDATGGDPGRPAFRVGYAELRVRSDLKRLNVSIDPRKEEYRPGESALFRVAVTDASGRPVVGEVTLWGVDEGILALTDYRTPDPLDSIWATKPISVMTTDSRQRLISRRVITPKGSTEGGGGGVSDDAMRKDFRPLAFWLGSVTTNEVGIANLRATLPDALTAYRVMAVASDARSRFGSAQTEIRTSKPVQIRAAFPRFLTTGDESSFGGLVVNQSLRDGHAIVTMRSLDGNVRIADPSSRTVEIRRGDAVEVPFAVTAGDAGTARVEMTVRIGDETDSFQVELPVIDARAPRVAALAGVSHEDVRQSFRIPERIVPDRGGLRVELASTALTGLRESARYLVTYPYGCAEQRASAALSLALSISLGEALAITEMSPVNGRAAVQSALAVLARYQCDSGGFSFWAGSCGAESPYLSAWLAAVLQDSAELGYDVDPAMLENVLSYLERELGFLRSDSPGDGRGIEWKAAVLRELARGGRNIDQGLSALWPHLDIMPMFAISDLLDAVMASGADVTRRDELVRRLRNATVLETETAHVEELEDERLEWFWSSTVRTTAMAIGSLTRAGQPQDTIAPMVRWLLDARENGRWGNTQENARAMRSLVAYRQRFESDTPDFEAVVEAAGLEAARAEFREPSDRVVTEELPMTSIAPDGNPREVPLGIDFTGNGSLYWTARLTWVPEDPRVAPADEGFSVSRTYAVLDDEGNVVSDGASKFPAGSVVRVTLRLELPQERRYVAVVDPLPAGLEAIDPRLSTSPTVETRHDRETDWMDFWMRGGFDHVERFDDRIQLFATRLSAGVHEYVYIARATTPGDFLAGAPRAEEMYHPEVRGNGATRDVTVD